MSIEKMCLDHPILNPAEGGEIPLPVPSSIPPQAGPTLGVPASGSPAGPKAVAPTPLPPSGGTFSVRVSQPSRSIAKGGKGELYV